MKNLREHETPVTTGSYSRHYHRPEAVAGKTWDHWVDGQDLSPKPGMRLFFGIITLGITAVGVVWFVW